MHDIPAAWGPSLPLQKMTTVQVQRSSTVQRHSRPRTGRRPPAPHDLSSVVQARRAKAGRRPPAHPRPVSLRPSRRSGARPAPPIARAARPGLCLAPSRELVLIGQLPKAPVPAGSSVLKGRLPEGLGHEVPVLLSQLLWRHPRALHRGRGSRSGAKLLLSGGARWVGWREAA